MRFKHMMHTLILSTTLSTTCFFAIEAPVVAANDQNLSILSIRSQPALHSFQVGSMYVEKYGHQGTPVILIPGLASGGWVWDNTVRQLEKNHVLYVVTLAGFDGKPAPVNNGPLMEKAYQSLLELIISQKLDQPVLVGHSLGATLSIWFAQQHSEKIRGVVAVDGLPVFPGTENTPAEQRPALAARFKTQMSGQTATSFAAQQLQYMRMIGVIDEQLAQNAALHTSKSDPAATADYASEIVNMDLRKDMAKIQVPLLEISPYYAPDFATRQISEEAKNAYYQSLLQGAPKLQVTGINNARHFLMLDQPQAFAKLLDNFLQAVK
ncbi:alpha/beta fold hydrolase [Undibacterium sp. TJN19]|uniref:alpha/beta fold hydrolase n=1 Tax=Undibacterium sp. TJN19 TaxID=3413055 RepID=UPI003BF17E19